jgi:hypothetical protein
MIKRVVAFTLCVGLTALLSGVHLFAQDAKPAPEKSAPTTKDANQKSYSGMYSFLKEGEFVQLTVEDEGRVTGFISRFEDAAGQGPFLNQFFKAGKLDGNKLSFTTQTAHGVSFDFKGTIDRGEGKNPGDEAYFVLNGTLTENSTDANKKVSSVSEIVALKSFPQEPK